MSAYLSSLIGNFSTDARAYVPTLANPDEPKRKPHIGTVAMFNPSWVAETEDLDILRRQILFYDTDPPEAVRNSSADPDMAALNIVGLLRGTQALAAELGGVEPQNDSEPDRTPPLPLVVLLAGGAFVVAEIEPNYFLVCFAAIPEAHSARHEAMIAQVQNAIAAAHSAFAVLHPPVARLEALLGRKGMSACFERHWRLWRGAYNQSAEYGPGELVWPNRLNPRGFLGMLPGLPFQRLSVHVSELLEKAVAEILTETHPGLVNGASHGERTTGGEENVSLDPGASGVLIFHTNNSAPKRAGLVHLAVAHGLLKTAVSTTCRLVELFLEQGALEPEILRRREPLVEIYSRMTAEPTSSDAESVFRESEASQTSQSPLVEPQNDSVTLSFPSMPQFLNPAAITDTLVVLPLNYSVSGIKSLGVAMNEQISGVTLWWPSSSPATAETADLEPEDTERGGRFLTGLANGETGPLLLYLPHSHKDAMVTHEYLLVLYQEADTLLAFIYDSGIEQLSNEDFYSRLHHKICEPLVEMVQECVLGAGSALSGSIGSLLVPLVGQGTAIAPDTDFFFVVYDCAEKSYQSSLPPLGRELPLRGLRQAVFHLHDQLVDHFMVKSAGRMFCPTSEVEEHLHKFSSNRVNDWLFYLIHHKQKRIVVIRNYNKNKTAKPEPKVADETYLHLLADSVYDYAHLGFLDSLGDDVKVWLEGLRRNAP